MMVRFVPDETRFYDGGSLDGSDEPKPGDEPRILLERVREPVGGRFRWLGGRTRMKETFRLERRIAYSARWREGRDLQIVVPARFPTVPPTKEFHSDLTSVPGLFTWLVPRTGSHLPAALVHDGMIHDPDEPASYEASEPVSREDADRIFRDAMGDLGTTRVRRWLMWSAVTLATVLVGVTKTPAPGKTSVDVATATTKGSSFWNWYYRVVAVGSLLTIAVLGVLATLDLFDLWDVLPWMGEQGVVRELFFGALFAFAIPAALSILWLRLWQAGIIAGIALALLFHVTVALALLTLVFHVIEFLARGPFASSRTPTVRLS